MKQFLRRMTRGTGSVALDRALMTLPFYFLFLAQLAHHEIWRDEINAWAISYTSPDIGTLLHRVHYEAHPAFWYLILYAASKFSHSLWMLKVVLACIGSGIYYVFGRYSPLRRPEHFLVLLSYYFVFEYTVLCRMYGLELLLALVYVCCRTQRPDRMVSNSLWLGLMANVDVTGAILASALLFEYLVFSLSENALSAKIKSAGASVAVFLLLFGVSIETLWPAKDIGWSTTGRMFSHFWDADHLVQAALKWIAVPWIPRSINILDSWDPTGWPYFFFAPMALMLLYVIFRDHARLGVMMLALVLTGILFTQITSVAGIRHTGVVFIAFVVALWILRAEGRNVSAFAYALLGLTAITGIIAISDQWSWTYSDTGPAARWILQNHLENLPMFGTPDTDMLGVPERLDRPFYQLECACVDRTLVFSKRRDRVDHDHAIESTLDVPTRLAAGMQSLHVPDGLLIITRPLGPKEQARLHAAAIEPRLLAKFTQGFLEEEHIYLYRVRSAIDLH